jgi:hypothetical protein
MDTYRTEKLTQSVRKIINSQEPIRNLNIQQSYHSNRYPSQDMRNFSLRNSIITHEEDNRSSQQSLQPRLPRNIYPGARSLSRI